MGSEEQCQYCDSQFQTEGQLVAHLSEEHSQEELSRIDQQKIEQHSTEQTTGLTRRTALAAVGTGAISLAGVGGWVSAQEWGEQASGVESSAVEQNIGFDFNWEATGPVGHDAAFIDDDGKTLTLCQGNLDTPSCNFVFEYAVGGTEQSVLSSEDYGTAGENGECPPGAELPITTKTPLTLTNCFNDNSFGQVFTPSSSGNITNFTMDMTFLSTDGGIVEDFSAILYDVNDGDSGVTIGNRIETVDLDLSGTGSVTKTSWDNYTFDATDFATISIPFSASVTAGEHYGVFFDGPFVPGEDLPGEEPTQEAVNVSADDVTFSNVTVKNGE